MSYILHQTLKNPKKLKYEVDEEGIEPGQLELGLKKKMN